MKLRVGTHVVDDVDVVVAGAHVTVTIGGLIHSFMYHSLTDGTLLIVGPSAAHRAWSDGEWSVVDGCARRVTTDAVRALPAHVGEVTPPMPAVVVNVLVAVNDVVAMGARLIVVSAMKTETTLRAPRAGRISAVRAVPGQNVRPGEILIDIEEAANP